jgi:hypothetical protein
MSSSTDFLPSREADLAQWTAQFAEKILLAPTSYSLTQAQATHFGELNTAWQEAFAAIRSDDTNTTSARVTKDEAKAAVISDARALARIIQASPTVTNTQRAALNLTVPDDVITPIPAPEIRPLVMIAKVVENTVYLRLIDEANPNRRGRPATIAGASIYSFTGPNPSAGTDGWLHQGNSSRMDPYVTLDPSLPAGTLVHFRAFYFTAKMLSGPSSTIAVASLNGVVLAQSA